MACTLLTVLYCKFALYERVVEWLVHCLLCCIVSLLCMSEWLVHCLLCRIVSLLCMSEWLSGLYIAYCAVL